jgi:hypothetical protein
MKITHRLEKVAFHSTERVKRIKRILKNCLDFSKPDSPISKLSNIFTPIEEIPRGRILKTQYNTGGGGLPTTALPGQGKDLPFFYSQRYAVYSSNPETRK